MEANAGEYIKNHLHLKRFPRISLHCKLVSLQYWEYEYGLLHLTSVHCATFNQSAVHHKQHEDVTSSSRQPSSRGFQRAN